MVAKLSISDVYGNLGQAFDYGAAGMIVVCYCFMLRILWKQMKFYKMAQRRLAYPVNTRDVFFATSNFFR